jgi:4-hydroxy-3-methylbut-2-en-1-yl diphosphate synthase IspG/GcpE
MALVKCPECSNDISDQAVSCPSCGYPFRDVVAVTEFREFRMRFRKRILTFYLISCIVCFPIGVALKLSLVWALCILGIVVASARLATLKV